MSHYYSREYSGQRAHRHHVRRRLEKKITTILMVVGPLLVLLSLVFFAASFAQSGATQHRWQKMSLVYVGAGVAALGVRWVMHLVNDRPATFYRPRVRGAATDEPPPETTGQEGAALVMVLVIVALIAGLVLEAQIAARAALRAEQQALVRSRLHEAAAGAAYAALQRLADDPDLRLDHTNETWAATEEATDPAGVSTRVNVTDEDRYVNLNRLAAADEGGRPAADVLMDIMTLCGDFAPVDRVESLASWMDPDDDGFAESALYRERTPPYQAANRPLYAWSELAWVNGFSRAYFARHEHMSRRETFNADLVDCVTVAPGADNAHAKVNVNTAPADVLLGVLGLPYDGIVRTILAARATEPLGSIEPLLAAADPVLAEFARAWLGVKSGLFLVDAQAYGEGQSERLRALARRGPEGTVDVLQWVY